MPVVEVLCQSSIGGVHLPLCACLGSIPCLCLLLRHTTDSLIVNIPLPKRYPLHAYHMIPDPLSLGHVFVPASKNHLMYLSGFLFKLLTRTIDNDLSGLGFQLFFSDWVGFKELGSELGLIFGQVRRGEREFHEVYFLIIQSASEVNHSEWGRIGADGL